MRWREALCGAEASDNNFESKESRVREKKSKTENCTDKSTGVDGRPIMLEWNLP
jgi:hypothetical protein